jgi:hypothetical protein
LVNSLSVDTFFVSMPNNLCFHRTVQRLTHNSLQYVSLLTCFDCI